jgi:fructoselysine-6-P-deglycase FrlB-like protein
MRETCPERRVLCANLIVARSGRTLHNNARNGGRTSSSARGKEERVSYVDEELASQPDCWERAAGLLPEVAGALPAPGERVAVVGCGTSWFMAMSYAVLREQAGHGETDAWPASELPVRRYDRLLVISRSGTTTEVLRVVSATTTPTTAIVGDPATPVGQAAEQVIALPFADERSVVQTRFATTALALLRAHLGADLGGAVADGRAALAAPLPVDPAGTEQVTFLGQGWTVGLAQEAALKCREAASLWTEAYPAMEYRHGPIAIAAPGRAVWAFGEVPDGLAAQVAATGAAFRQVPSDPMADLILAQRFAVAVAAHRGLDPDSPRHLTRSVILP